jgi:ribosomal protein S18 acetylase RimI-like enzyme
VRRPWRGKGLGLALLRHSFVEFHRLGRKHAALHADAENITGALRLYTNAGMRIERQTDLFEKELRPGRELATRTLED